MGNHDILLFDEISFWGINLSHSTGLMEIVFNYFLMMFSESEMIRDISQFYFKLKILIVKVFYK